MQWVDAPLVHLPSPLSDLHPLLAAALLRRGITTSPAARAFLNPAEYAPSSAAEIPGLPAVAGRLEQAIRSREKICVWGDFDVDGQTSTTILFQALQELGAQVVFHIPIREKEGHGVHVDELAGVVNEGARLILTCDTGISAHVAVEYACSRGVDFIITDHHALPSGLPRAAAIANPRFLPPSHPLSTLSGSGLAFKLTEALFSRFHRAGEAARFLDLATLGLVADLASLTGDSRHIVQLGLAVLRSEPRLGLQVMFENANLSRANLTEEHISFAIAPRLNALGRLGDANPIVEFFITADPARARLLAVQLENLNSARQRLCAQVSQAAEALLARERSLLDSPVIILDHVGWHPGVVGIVASSLVEKYRKPAILFSSSPDGVARGSARSIPALDITAAISAHAHLLLGFGGHPMAAGLSLRRENLPEFRARLAHTVRSLLAGQDLEDRLVIDAWLTLPECSLDLASALESLSPCGPGNEKLILAARDLHLVSSSAIGKNKEHLKLVLADDSGNSQSVLWWDGGGEVLPEGKFDLAFSLRAADWRGERQVQLELVALRELEQKPPEVAARKVEVFDHRRSPDPFAALEELCCLPSTIIWSEGAGRKKVNGVSLQDLSPAENLVIWTAPASPEDLRQALEMTQPRAIHLFALDVPTETPAEFIDHLARLLKFVLQQKDGTVTLSELAAAMAERPAAVRLGLGCLADAGSFAIHFSADGIIEVCAGSGALRSDVTIPPALASLLQETSAWHAYFRNTDKDMLGLSG